MDKFQKFIQRMGMTILRLEGGSFFYINLHLAFDGFLNFSNNTGCVQCFM